MNRKLVLLVIVAAAVAYWAGSSAAPKTDRPILRWISRAVGLWLMVRDEPPRQENQARYVHLEPGAVDHRNAL